MRDTNPPPDRLRLTGIARRFSSGAGVHDISLAIAPGEVVCLLGPSGCGKSTTLRVAAGVERADAGSVHIDGQTMQDARCFVPPERRHVGLMFQDYALFPHLSVLGNVMFGLDNLPKSQARDIAIKALEQVGLTQLANAYPHALSGGEQQRVALARAMAPGPKLMLMDEPFSGLDTRLRDEVRDRTMAVLQAAGASALIVTHDPDEAMAIANRIILLRKGRVIQDATPSDIYERPVDAQTALFFSDHVVLAGVAQSGQVSTVAGPVPTNLADGTPVNVLVRPEAIILSTTNGAPANVLNVRKVGPDIVVDLEVSPSLSVPVKLRALLRDDAAPVVGTMVRIGLHPHRTLVLANRT